MSSSRSAFLPKSPINSNVNFRCSHFHLPSTPIKIALIHSETLSLSTCSQFEITPSQTEIFTTPFEKAEIEDSENISAHSQNLLSCKDQNCDKSFSSEANLIKHMRTHKGLK